MVLDNSKSVKWLLSLYKKLKKKTNDYTQTSRIISFIQQLKKEFYPLPLKTFGIIAVVGTSTNIFFSILNKKELGFLSWVIQGFIIFIGLDGFFSNATWQDIKKTSYFLRCINNSCKL